MNKKKNLKKAKKKKTFFFSQVVLFVNVTFCENVFSLKDFVWKINEKYL